MTSVGRVKGRLQRGHVVEHGTKCPNVTHPVVFLPFPDLGRNIIQRAYKRLRLRLRVVEDLGDAEVSQLHDVLARQKDVIRF